MSCPECGGWMRPEKEEIGTDRGLIIETWTECEDCGHVSEEWEDVLDAQEDEAERRCFDPDGMI